MFKRRIPVRRPVAGIRHLFHGVAIKCTNGGRCAAVAALEGKRFLSDEAPMLPLADCDIPDACKCIYEHFNDRRTALRRDSDAGLPPAYYPGERRTRTSRRITDG